MQVKPATLPGVLVFRPEPFRDERGLFTRTFDLELAREHGLPEFLQDSQSRSHRGTVRGLHGRAGTGEAKLVRCARGAVYDVLVDARPESPRFGEHEVFRLDDETFDHLFVPSGLLHGFQALTELADVCYRIDSVHRPGDDLQVRFDDPDLSIDWPLPVSFISARDSAAGSWREVCSRL